MFENHRKEKWFFLVLLFILAIIAFVLFIAVQAQAQKTEKPFINIQEIKTGNGLTLWHVEDRTLPIVSLKFMVKGHGTTLDPDDKQGMIRLLSNTMDEGAGKLNGQDFQKQLSDHSISLAFNAGRDYFGGDLITLSRNKEKAFELLTLSISQPRFDEEAIVRMGDANITRIKSSLSEPDWIAARILNDKFFQGHPYSKNSGGTISGLKSITPDHLKAAHKKILSKNNLLIASAGDISANEISQAVDRIFYSLPLDTEKNSIKNLTYIKNTKPYLFEKDIPQTMVEIMIPTFDQKDPDYYALQVLNYIFGGAGFGSRLMQTAREERGLTYGIYSDLQDMDYADMMSISTSTKNESVVEMMAIITSEMEKLKTTKVGEKELQNAKSYITGSMPLALKSTGDFADIALSLQAQEKPIDYLEHYDDRINSVTSDDILRVAKRVLIKENMVTVLVGMPINLNNITKIESIPNVE